MLQTKIRVTCRWCKAHGIGKNHGGSRDRLGTSMKLRKKELVKEMELVVQNGLTQRGKDFLVPAMVNSIDIILECI